MSNHDKTTVSGETSPVSSAPDGAGRASDSVRAPLRGMSYGAGAAFLMPRQVQRSSRPGGLPAGLGAKMEGAFGADFSDVRVHQDGAAEAIGAKAFTRGHDIHFARGQFDPDSAAGQALVGHELTHVVQQRAGRVPRHDASPLGAVAQAKADDAGVRGVVQTDAALESEADAIGARVARGERVALPGGTSAPGDDASQPLQGAFVFAGLVRSGGAMVGRAVVREGALRVARQQAVELIRNELPKLDGLLADAARQAIASSPEVRVAIDELRDLDAKRALITQILTPLSQELARYLQDRLARLGVSVAAYFPNMPTLLSDEARARIDGIVARIRAIVPTEILTGLGAALRDTAAAHFVGRGVEAIGGMIRSDIVKGAVGAGKEAMQGAMAPIVEGGQALAEQTSGLVETMSALADAGASGPEGLVRKAVSHTADAAFGSAADVGGAVREGVEGMRQSANQQLLEQGRTLEASLKESGMTEQAMDIGTLITAVRLAHDVTEAKTAEEGLQSVLDALSSVAGAAAGTYVGGRLGGKAGGLKAALAGAGAGAVVGTTLKLALKKIDVAGHLAGAGRALARRDDLVGDVSRVGYVAGDAVVSAVGVPMSLLGVVGGAARSLVLQDGSLGRSFQGVGRSIVRVGGIGARARENVDPSAWQAKPPSPGGAGAEPKKGRKLTFLEEFALAQLDPARQARVRARLEARATPLTGKPRTDRKAVAGGQAKPRAKGPGAATGSGSAPGRTPATASAPRQAQAPAPQPGEARAPADLRIELGGVERLVAGWESSLVKGLEAIHAKPAEETKAPADAARGTSPTSTEGAAKKPSAGGTYEAHAYVPSSPTGFAGL